MNLFLTSFIHFDWLWVGLFSFSLSSQYYQTDNRSIIWHPTNPTDDWVNKSTKSRNILAIPTLNRNSGDKLKRIFKNYYHEKFDNVKSYVLIYIKALLIFCCEKLYRKVNSQNGVIRSDQKEIRDQLKVVFAGDPLSVRLNWAPPASLRRVNVKYAEFNSSSNAPPPGPNFRLRGLKKLKYHLKI